MADGEIAHILGRGDVFFGKAMLESMKAARALDVGGDGRIDGAEFFRLCNPEVIAAAEAAVAADHPQRSQSVTDEAVAAVTDVLAGAFSAVAALGGVFTDAVSSVAGGGKTNGAASE
jgi:hypothetical protein